MSEADARVEADRQSGELGGVALFASQPTGRAPRHFMGRALLVTFRTELDLSEWTPPQLSVGDPHIGLLKVYEMKTRFDGDAPQPLALSQYQEACIGVMARRADQPSGAELRGYNLINWHSSPLAVGRENPFGHRLRQGNVEATWTFPCGADYDRDVEWRHFDVDVDRLGRVFLSFRSVLGEDSPRTPEPSFNGFFTLSAGAVNADGSPGDVEVVEESLESLIEGRPTYGTGTLKFSALPDDREPEASLLSGLDEVEVLGCSLRDIRWVRQFPHIPT